MLTSYLFTKAVPVHGKMPGTPEKATARAAPRKWSSRRGVGQGRDGDAVCAEVCRPSCRWAKARRQKTEDGGAVRRRKKGEGAEERRWLRRRLEELLLALFNCYFKGEKLECAFLWWYDIKDEQDCSQCPLLQRSYEPRPLQGRRVPWCAVVDVQQMSYRIHVMPRVEPGSWEHSNMLALSRKHLGV